MNKLMFDYNFASDENLSNGISADMLSTYKEKVKKRYF